MAADYHLRFPIGEHQYRGLQTAAERSALIDRIESFPARFRRSAERLSDTQLETRYRPGGWTARQVIHHVADSHAHAYLRFKFGLAEEGITITPYAEELWAELPDYQGAPIGLALAVIDALHAKWVYLLRRLNDADFQRTFHHPVGGPTTLDKALSIYAWHGDHHLAHMEIVLGGGRG